MSNWFSSSGAGPRPAAASQAAFLLVMLAVYLSAEPRCFTCHPKEVQAYSQSAMARALSRPADQPGGTFEHLYSHTTFTTYSDSAGLRQRLVRNGEVAEQGIAYVIGSGSHAFGYLVRVGDHLFQSPVCYYTQSKSWGIAPGYELDPHPDFSRPVPVACLLCHSGSPQAQEGTINRYADNAFSAEGISCERCHGSAAEHLRKPVAGSIVNPAKLTGPSRDSVCEQCHLAGEVRIPNPGRTLADYVPGEKLEDTFTIYVRAQPSSGPIKVVSHVEQLALSACERNSGGRLWCGTCHNPHQTVTRPVEYFRERCLGCHAATLDKGHAAAGRNCVGCHMPRKPTTDGGHTIFTDHRIARHPEVPGDGGKVVNLRAWREPEAAFRYRNMGLALADFATQKKSAAQMVEAFRLLYRIEKSFSKDPAVVTALGSLLFIAQDTQEAENHYRQAVALRPDFAPYQVNLAAALGKEGRKQEAQQYLEKALQLDPLLESGVQILSGLYQELGEKEKAEALSDRYRLAMGYQPKR
jgi:hypothetical protein